MIKVIKWEISINPQRSFQGMIGYPSLIMSVKNKTGKYQPHQGKQEVARRKLQQFVRDANYARSLGPTFS